MRITTLGATLVAMGLAMGGAYAQQAGPGGQSGAFCLQTTSGTKTCTFATMAACNAAKTGQSDSCAANAAAGSTTGASPSGAMAPAAAPARTNPGGPGADSGSRPAGAGAPTPGGGSPANR
jgi:hypothetical protein